MSNLLNCGINHRTDESCSSTPYAFAETARVQSVNFLLAQVHPWTQRKEKDIPTAGLTLGTLHGSPRESTRRTVCRSIGEASARAHTGLLSDRVPRAPAISEMSCLAVRANYTHGVIKPS